MTNEHQVPVRDVDAKQAAAMARDGALLLDVREDEEWRAGHIYGSVHMPSGDLDLLVVGKDVDLVVVCRSGNRSSKAAASLAQVGRRVVNLAGGLKSWQEAGLDLVTDDGEPGVVA